MCPCRHGVGGGAEYCPSLAVVRPLRCATVANFYRPSPSDSRSGNRKRHRSQSYNLNCSGMDIALQDGLAFSAALARNLRSTPFDVPATSANFSVFWKHRRTHWVVGYRQIWRHPFEILDGGNRYRACLEAGVEPQFVEYDGNDPAHFVLSSNFFRRHLTSGQQATVVALAQDWTRAQQRGGDRKSDQAATLPLDSVASRQSLSGAGDRTQRDADKLARTSPELAKKVVDGELTLPQALKKIAPEPEPERPREIPVGDEMRRQDQERST